jgi:hypothetical protein
MGDIQLLTENELTWIMAEKLRKVWNAWVKHDEAAHDELLAEDYRAVYSDGTVHVGGPAAGEMDAQPVEDYWLKELQAWPVGQEAAIVSYVAEVKSPAKETRLRFLVGEVWVKRAGQWKELHYQETRVK